MIYWYKTDSDWSSGEIGSASEFKLGSEILRTVIVKELSEVALVAAIIAVRATLTFLIHREIKTEK